MKLLRREYEGGSIAWEARWRDPDTGRPTKTSLTKLGLTSDEARRDWCIRKSKTLSGRLAALESGAPPEQTSTLIPAAVAAFLESVGRRGRPSAVRAYRECLDEILEWAAGRRFDLLEDLTRPLLVDLRETIIGRPKRTSAKGTGAGRGGKLEARVRRSSHTINKTFRHVKAALNHWRRLGLTPRLDSDAVKDGLRNLRPPRVRPEYLRPDELRKLLEATIRHDEETYRMTRGEKGTGGPGGSIPRYDPIAPLTVFVLLSGCRAGEALALEWSWIRLDALDGSGLAVGEIVIPAEVAKTSQERAIDLSVSPALRALLAALYLRRGDGEHVFRGREAMTRPALDAAHRRLLRSFGAPEFSWQRLRQTTDTFLVNAPGIFGGASAYRAAKQLGHSVAVAEKHYQGLATRIPREARTLEAAMQVEDLVGEVIARAGGGTSKTSAAASG